jgi:hypothetical protein
MFAMVAIASTVTATVQAQSNPTQSSQNNENVTLSGESLVDVNSRDTSGDYQTFFLDSSDERKNSGSLSIGVNLFSPPTVELDEGVGVVFGDTLTSGDAENVQQVKLEFDLNNNN